MVAALDLRRLARSPAPSPPGRFWDTRRLYPGEPIEGDQQRLPAGHWYGWTALMVSRAGLGTATTALKVRRGRYHLRYCAKNTGVLKGAAAPRCTGCSRFGIRPGVGRSRAKYFGEPVVTSLSNFFGIERALSRDLCRAPDIVAHPTKHLSRCP